MIIQINETTSLAAISGDFSNAFPFLKISFFKQPHNPGMASDPRQLLAEDKTIAAIDTTQKEGALEIHAWHTTAAVEKAFLEFFGLHVQVMRRRGHDWLQTTLSDKLSLAEQNALAENLEQELLYGEDRRHENGAG